MRILITGARSGIGLSSGLLLAKEGHEVFLGTRTEKQRQELKRYINNLGYDNIKVIKLDITNREDRRKILNLDLDTLVNNASICIGGNILDIKTSDIRKNFEINYFFTIKLTKVFASYLNKNQKEGNIVVMSSLAGILPVPYIASYAATKAALLSTFTILRDELLLEKSKIRVKIVEPGLYHTGFNQVMLDKAKEISKNKEFIEFEKSVIKFLEINNLTSISKKVAKAATSKNNRLKYRSPFSQVLFAKIYMLLFK